MTPLGQRRADKLLTLDRALLVGLFTAGAWYATTDLRAGNVNERVIKLEQRQERMLEQRGVDAVDYAREYATITQQLKEQERRLAGIEENMSKLAGSTARLANAVQDPR